MKEIKLKQLELTNFKKTKSLVIDFKQVTNIRGKNESGKTTIFDAFTWLLFDKDSSDRSNFDIKTLDETGQPYHGLDHNVTGVLEVDGNEWKLSKTYKEKWVKKRGDVNKELTGHETIHEINGVPVSKSEYTNKINDFIDSDSFKLLTNPLYFSIGLDWKKRRAILIDILGQVADEQVIYYNEDLKPLESRLEGMDVDTLLKQTKASKTKLNNEIKAIPTRIDEASRSIKELDFKAILKEKTEIEKELEKVQLTLSSNTVDNESKLKIRDQIYDIKTEMKDFEYNYKNKIKTQKQPFIDKINELKDDLETEENEIRKANRELTIRHLDLEGFEKKLAKGRKDYIETSNEKLDIPEHIKECPTCKRAFEESTVHEEIEKLEANFNLNKANNLERLINYGNGIKEDQTITIAKVHELEKEIEKTKGNIEKLAESLETEKEKLFNIPDEPFTQSKEYLAMEEKLAQLEIQFQSNDGAEAREELKTKENELKLQIKDLDSELIYQQMNETLRERVKGLEEELRDLSQKFADLENIEYLCEEFIRTKVELLENEVNKKFDFVKFKLFATQVNGGIAETCEALINGVPFSTANTASKLNAGIDIVNTLSEHLQVNAPIFLDNRESVTDIIESKSQLVNLFVDANEKQLRVEE